MVLLEDYETLQTIDIREESLFEERDKVQATAPTTVQPDHQHPTDKQSKAVMKEALQGLLNRSTVDFNGAGYTQFAYRIGDVFDLFYLDQYQMSFDELERFYERLFPQTLAHRYLMHVKSQEYGHRNLTALLEVLKEYETELSKRQASIVRPGPHDLVLHLRLGDVLTSDCCTTSTPISALWHNTTSGFTNVDGDVKHNYNRKEYLLLLKRLPSTTFDRSVLVGASKFLTLPARAHRNHEYQVLVEDLLQEQLGCEIVRYANNDNPDENLLFLSSANWLIVGMGGYAQIAAALATVRGGVALFDKFDGQIASWHSEWFSPQQRAVYSESYIDWSRFPALQETVRQYHRSRNALR